MIIPRILTQKINYSSKKFPIIALTGPRQSGKTTLLQKLFPDYNYVSLEEPDRRALALDDPRGFLDTFPPPVIFDEIQHAPELFSYIQTLSDKLKKQGQFILSGSQNFLLLEKISQSLAGRAAILNLLPFSIDELQKAKIIPSNLDNLLLKGFYPRIWDKKINPLDWHSSYIQTYLERDVRQIKQIDNLLLFQKFLKLCAGRTGQILNLSSFANDLGINHNTVRSWLSILETSFLIFLLPPYYKNFNKRLIKSPKLYFYDVGLACYLLGIQNTSQLKLHPLKGQLFENLVVSELQKYHYHRGLAPQAYFFRDKLGKEIDYLCQTPKGVLSVEIKAGQTISSQYFKNLIYWQSLTKNKPSQSFVVYSGDQIQKTKHATVLPWQKMLTIFG